MTSFLKTTILLAAMTALFMGIGAALGGQSGMMIALLIALAMNGFAYWNSDKLALRAYRAQPIERGAHPQLDAMLDQLSQNAGIPRPAAYVIENAQPNAFATGRNPDNAAVAVTTGLLQRLNDREVAGVIAHELAHIKHRDTLIMTITATLAGAIGMLTHLAYFMGGNNARGANPLVMIAAAIFAPLAAMLVQMAISRTREYAADREGAIISGYPNDLADALEKIARTAPAICNRDAESHPETAHLFIFNPLLGGKFSQLFSTHPDPAERIRRLRAMAPATQRAVASGPWG